MKKKIGMLMVAVTMLLMGTAGCSAGKFHRSSGESGIMGDLVQKILRSEEAGDDSAENRQRDEDKDDKNENSENQDNTEENGILNNGGTVVRFQGNDYYWKYTEDSAENEGLFANYVLSDVSNSMICRHPDGGEEVLFSMAGNGKIYLAGDRMYLSANNGAYSVKMDGSDKIDYGYCRWEAVDAEGEVIIGYAEQKLFCVNSRTGERKELADSSEETYNYCFVGTADNYLYYSSCDTERNELVLYQYNLKGTAEIQEAARTSLPGDAYYVPGNVIVTQLERLGKTLYYSFGFYAGTGGFFQTGGINYAVQDENRKTVESGALVEGITAEEFLVENGMNSVNIYFIDNKNGSYIGYWQNTSYSGCSVMNSETRTVQPSDFRLSRPGAAVYIDGAICKADEHQASFTVLIPEPLATSYGCRNENLESASVITLINDVEVIGNDVYYTVEKSSREPQNDVGWRPGFVRNSSQRYKMTVGGNDAQLLFSY